MAQARIPRAAKTAALSQLYQVHIDDPVAEVDIESSDEDERDSDISDNVPEQIPACK